MIRLQLNLPEGTVSYNETGAMLGVPVEHTPIQIKNFGMPFEITGYITKNDFLAYSLYSSARKFTVAEQISMLTVLGFKTVPYFENENGQGNQLITLKNQYSMYDAKWISLPSGKEFKIPELAHINSIEYVMGADRALTLRATTDKGVFDVIDMKLVAYFQPGCTAKVWNDELQPMNTAPVTCPPPTFCPKCNNPLKRVQIYPDLPMFYKCTNSICDILVLDEPAEGTQGSVEEEITAATVQENFPEQGSDEVTGEPISGDTVPGEVVTDDTETADAEVIIDTAEEAAVAQPVKCYVDSAKVDAEVADKLVAEGKIIVVDDIEDASCILVKTKLAVSKNARSLSKEFNKELIPVTDFE